MSSSSSSSSSSGAVGHGGPPLVKVRHGGPPRKSLLPGATKSPDVGTKRKRSITNGVDPVKVIESEIFRLEHEIAKKKAKTQEIKKQLSSRKQDKVANASNIEANSLALISLQEKRYKLKRDLFTASTEAQSAVTATDYYNKHKEESDVVFKTHPIRRWVSEGDVPSAEVDDIDQLWAMLQDHENKFRQDLEKAGIFDEFYGMIQTAKQKGSTAIEWCKTKLGINALLIKYSNTSKTTNSLMITAAGIIATYFVVPKTTTDMLNAIWENGNLIAQLVAAGIIIEGSKYVIQGLAAIGMMPGIFKLASCIGMSDHDIKLYIIGLINQFIGESSYSDDWVKVMNAQAFAAFRNRDDHGMPEYLAINYELDQLLHFLQGAGMASLSRNKSIPKQTAFAAFAEPAGFAAPVVPKSWSHKQNVIDNNLKMLEGIKEERKLEKSLMSRSEREPYDQSRRKSSTLSRHASFPGAIGKSSRGGSHKRHHKKPSSSSYINLHKSRKHIEKFIKYTKKLNLNTNIPKIAKNVTPKRLNAIKNKLYKSFKQELFKK